MNAGPAANQFFQQPQIRQIFQYLSGCGVNIKRYSIMNLFFIYHECGYGKITQTRISRRSDIGLINLAPGNLPDGDHVAWTAGQCN